MSATQDLRSCLLSLCEIIENILPNLQKGIISPELFRLAKQDDLEAVKVKILLFVMISIVNWHFDPVRSLGPLG